MYLTLLGVGILGALLVAPRVEDPAAVVAALPPTLAGAYLAWSALGVLALVGVIVSGFAFGCRPSFLRPADWDGRVVLTGVTAAALYVPAFHNAAEPSAPSSTGWWPAPSVRTAWSPTPPARSPGSDGAGVIGES
ncbi:hypothetical protein ACQEV2_08065 [Streptomyces sp. CA-251387]|uniref:hypothetical protein n=1 Tax=Streptomyces sp. CA-251387 TaxID=3240064 RepID=UPI003D8F95A8